LGGVTRSRAAALVIAALSSAPLLAQPVRDRDPSFLAARQIAADLVRATYHWGPFYLLSRLQLADVGFDQQISIPTEEQVGGFGVGISAPQRLYFVPRKKVVFSLDAVPSYHWFSSSDRNNQLGYSLRGDAHFIFNHLYLNFHAAQADQLQASTVEVNRLVTQRRTQTGASGELKYSTRTSVTFAASFHDARHPASRLQPTDKDVSRLDRSEERVQAAFIHKTFPLTSLFATTHLHRYDFVSANESDSRRAYLGGGFVFETRGTLIRTELGPAVLDFRTPGREDFRGALGNLQATRRAGNRWQFAALGLRDLEFSITPENSYYVADRGALNVEYGATRRLSLRGGTQAGRDIYPVPVEGIRRRDTFRFTSAGWSYTTRRVRGGFDVGYFDRSSTVQVDEQNGIRVLVHLSFTP
jgi:hypothetical protein